MTNPVVDAPVKPIGERLAASKRHEFGVDEHPPPKVHPKIARTIALWQSMTPAPSLLPGRQHFDPMSAPDLLNNMWLLEVVPEDPRRYRFRLVGGALVEAGTRFRKGTFITDVGSPDEAAMALAAFDAQSRSRLANWRRGPSALGHLDYVYELERVSLPMARDGSHVDLFMCVTVFYYSDGRVL